MLLDDCYRILDLEPGASDEEVQRSHRDLMKVWHPDRFGHDPALRRKAEEKLKAINDAHDTICAVREGGWSSSDAAPDERPAGGAWHQKQRIRRYQTWATTCALLAIYFLLRRPTPAGLVIALILLGVAAVLLFRMSALPRE